MNQLQVLRLSFLKLVQKLLQGWEIRWLSEISEAAAKTVRSIGAAKQSGIEEREKRRMSAAPTATIITNASQNPKRTY